MYDVLTLARRVAERLGQAQGVESVSLGGVWAYPDPPLEADLDLYVYHRPERRPEAATVRALLRDLQADVPDVAAPDLLDPEAPFAVWIWLDGHRVGLHYRDLRVVESAIREGLAGALGGRYSPVHLHGVFHPTLMGEVHDARALYDPQGTLAELRTLTNPYPYELRRSVLSAFGDEAERMLFAARQAVGQGDLYLAAGALARGAACVAQILFAANGRYLAFDRAVLARLQTLPDRPADAPDVLARALGGGPPLAPLDERVDDLRALVGEVRLRFVQPTDPGD